MATPIAHTMAGIMVFYCFTIRAGRNALLFFMLLFVAVLPDIDFLFGFLVGNPNKYHHYFTHSILFVVAMGILFAILMSGRSLIKWRYLSCLFAGSGLTHLLLDFITKDQRAPFGIPLLWPFSERYFISPVQILSDVYRSSESAIFFQSMLNWHNFYTVILEIALLLPLIVLIYYFDRKKTV